MGLLNNDLGVYYYAGLNVLVTALLDLRFISFTLYELFWVKLGLLPNAMCFCPPAAVLKRTVLAWSTVSEINLFAVSFALLMVCAYWLVLNVWFLLLRALPVG